MKWKKLLKEEQAFNLSHIIFDMIDEDEREDIHNFSIKLKTSLLMMQELNLMKKFSMMKK